MTKPMASKAPYQLPPVRRSPPRSKYRTPTLEVGDSFELSIEAWDGSYDWRAHNRIRSSVYDYVRHGGKSKKFSVIQFHNNTGALFVRVTRTK